MTYHALLILHTATILVCLLVAGAIWDSRKIKRLFPRYHPAMGVVTFVMSAFIASALNLWFASL